MLFNSVTVYISEDKDVLCLVSIHLLILFWYIIGGCLEIKLCIMYTVNIQLQIFTMNLVLKKLFFVCFSVYIGQASNTFIGFLL